MTRKNGVYEDVDEILDSNSTEETVTEDTRPCISNPTLCPQHSGVKTAVRYLAKDNEAQWKAIRTISNRIWAVLIGVCGTFFLVLVQMFLTFIKTQQ